MQPTAELQVIPLGAGVSARREIEPVVGLLKDYGFSDRDPCLRD